MIPTAFIQAFNTHSSSTFKSFYETGYYSLGGLLSGMLLTELWKKFSLPGNNEKITTSLLTNKPLENTNLTKDKMYQLIIAGGVILSEFFGVKGGMVSGLTMIAGIEMMHSSQNGKYIGQS